MSCVYITASVYTSYRVDLETLQITSLPIHCGPRLKKHMSNVKVAQGSNNLCRRQLPKIAENHREHLGGRQRDNLAMSKCLYFPSIIAFVTFQVTTRKPVGPK